MNFKRIMLFILLTTTILSTSCGATEDDDSYADYDSISSAGEETSLDSNLSTSLDVTTVTDTTTSVDTSKTDTTEDTTTSTDTSKTTTSVGTSKTTTSAKTSKTTTVTTAVENDSTTPKNNVQNTTVENVQIEDNTTPQVVAELQQGAEAIQNDLPVNTSNGTFEDSDMILTYNGQSISVDMSMSDILALIGDPYDYQSNLGCYNEWNDEVYIYNDIQVDANTYDGNIYEARIITILNSNVSTSKGIVIGSTVQDMENAYGTQYMDMGNMYIYTASNGSTLYFMADENGVIISIIYNSYNL